MCFRRRCHSVINIVMSMWMSALRHKSVTVRVRMTEWPSVHQTHTHTHSQAGSHERDSKMLTRTRAVFSVTMQRPRVTHLRSIDIECVPFEVKWRFIFSDENCVNLFQFLKILFSIIWMQFGLFAVSNSPISRLNFAHISMAPPSVLRCQNGSNFIPFHCCTCQECQVKLSNCTKHKLISIFSFSIEHNHHLFKLNAIRCEKKKKSDLNSSAKIGDAHNWATLNRMEIIEMLSPFIHAAAMQCAYTIYMAVDRCSRVLKSE